MAKEIERKFIVTDLCAVKARARTSCRICQSYLSVNPDATVRVRMKNDKAFITVKGRNNGAIRDEWEYVIPATDAEEMACRLCGGWAIDKTRYIIDHAGLTWEIDEFHGRYKGLVIAEVELADERIQVDIPPFAGKEVTGDPQYYNSTLSTMPDKGQ